MQKRFCSSISCSLALASTVAAAILSCAATAQIAPTPSASAGTASQSSAPEIPLPIIATGVPSMPGPSALPVNPAIPPVLQDANGKPIRSLKAWQSRREEVRRTLAYYATGQMPPAPTHLAGEVLRTEPVLDGKATYRLVRITFSTDGSRDPSHTLSLHIGLWTPAGTGSHPAIIFQGSEPPGGPDLPRANLGPLEGKGLDVLTVTGGGARKPMVFPASTAEQFATQRREVLARGYAIAMFNPNDCAEDTTLREADGSFTFRHTRFPAAYPHYDWGVLAAWAWGASRVADYLQTLPEINPKALLVTGASRWGKSSLIAAAFDDRLMGAPVVTGGGGVGAYRLTGADGSETLDQMVRKYPNWFSPQLRAFGGQRDRLPFDESWFLALAAPRPFIALEGVGDVISSPTAVRASIDAARPVYTLYGVSPDRLRAHYSHHGHAFTAEDWTAMMDEADAFLLGKQTPPPAEHFPTADERTAAIEAARTSPRPGSPAAPAATPNPNASAHVPQ